MNPVSPRDVARFQANHKTREDVEMQVTSPRGCESVFSLTSCAGSRAHLYHMAEVSAVASNGGSNNVHASPGGRSAGFVERPSLAKVKVS